MDPYSAVRRRLILRKVLAGMAIAFGIAMLVWVVAGAALLAWVFRPTDWSRVPKSEVFQLVWRRPVPAGVTDLRIAGHGAGQGQDVFMRLEAPIPVLRSLIGGNESISRGELDTWCRDRNRADMAAVGWPEIAQARAPAYFALNSHATQGWVGVLAVDRDRGVMWAAASAL